MNNLNATDILLSQDKTLCIRHSFFTEQLNFFQYRYRYINGQSKPLYRRHLEHSGFGAAIKSPLGCPIVFKIFQPIVEYPPTLPRDSGYYQTGSLQKTRSYGDWEDWRYRGRY